MAVAGFVAADFVVGKGGNAAALGVGGTPAFVFAPDLVVGKGAGAGAGGAAAGVGGGVGSGTGCASTCTGISAGACAGISIGRFELFVVGKGGKSTERGASVPALWVGVPGGADTGAGITPRGAGGVSIGASVLAGAGGAIAVADFVVGTLLDATVVPLPAAPAASAAIGLGSCRPTRTPAPKHSTATNKNTQIPMTIWPGVNSALKEPGKGRPPRLIRLLDMLRTFFLVGFRRLRLLRV